MTESVVSLPQADSKSQPEPSGDGEQKDDCVTSRKWSDPTYLVQCYGSKAGYRTFNTVIDHLSSLETEAQLEQFLIQYPITCGWLHPLLDQFRTHRKQSVVLLILHCPRRDKYVDLQQPTLLTEWFITGFTTCQDLRSFLLASADFHSDLAQRGISSIVCNLRKECRRSRDDKRCMPLDTPEATVYTMATYGEILVARNVYNITYQATVGISANACHRIDKLAEHPAARSLMGRHLHHIHWHPSLLTEFFFNEGRVATQEIIRHLVLESYGPVIESILLAFDNKAKYNQDELWDHLWLTWLSSQDKVLFQLMLPSHPANSGHDPLLEQVLHGEDMIGELLVKEQKQRNQLFKDVNTVHLLRVKEMLDLLALLSC